MHQTFENNNNFMQYSQHYGGPPIVLWMVVQHLNGSPVTL